MPGRRCTSCQTSTPTAYSCTTVMGRYDPALVRDSAASPAPRLPTAPPAQRPGFTHPRLRASCPAAPALPVGLSGADACIARSAWPVHRTGAGALLCAPLHPLPRHPPVVTSPPSDAPSPVLPKPGGPPPPSAAERAHVTRARRIPCTACRVSERAPAPCACAQASRTLWPTTSHASRERFHASHLKGQVPQVGCAHRYDSLVSFPPKCVSALELDRSC